MTNEEKKMVEKLRNGVFAGCSDCPVGCDDEDCTFGIVATMIESTSAELEQVKRERDEAWKIVEFVSRRNEIMADALERVKRERDELLKQLRGDCGICAHWQECVENDFALDRNYNSCWQWRGVKED